VKPSSVGTGTLTQLLTAVRSSLWFVPSLIVLFALALALGLIQLDQHVDPGLRERWPWLLGADAEGARAMLSAIATSMITVAGVVFSITIVALSLAASQYTSRILRTFMRDPANQIVLGVFVGIYTYCLIVLRTISSGEGAFAPALAIFGGVVLAILGIGVLIFFIHHIAASIQASEIIAAIAQETSEAVERLFPQELGDEAAVPGADPERALAGRRWQAIAAEQTGYIQSIDAEGLLALAREGGTVVRMTCGVGEFAIGGRPLAWLATDEPPGADVVKALNRLYAIDGFRTVAQDAAFGIRQLVDIALKALSPGVNDTTTAVTCLDYLTAILLRCASRRIESPYRSENGELRVIAKGPSFAQLVALAFDQIRESGEGNTAVITRMLGALEQLLAVTQDERRREVLLRQVEVVAESAERSVSSPYAQGLIEEQLERIAAETRGQSRDDGAAQGGPRRHR